MKSAIEAIGDEADLIVVAAHMGMYAEFDEENCSDSAQKILDDNPEVDILLSGHMHIQVNEKQDAGAVGAPRNAARDIVHFDVTLDANKTVVDATVSLIDMADIEPSQEIRDIPLVAEAHQRTIDFIAGGTGDDEEGGAALGSATAKFQPEDEIAGIPSSRIMDTAVMDLINQIQLENSGTELKAYMEWSAECYNQWVPGDISISFDPEYPDYLYDMFAGVDYEIDLSQPKGQRIKNVMFKGEPLQDDQQLTLAVNNYRYSSALKAFNLVSGKKEWESSCSIRDMIVAYFAEHSPVASEVDNNWRIVGVDLQLDIPMRAELIEKTNAGEIDTPYAKSLNLNDYE